jgi:alcohol dehydrogenase (cytochrome c)
MSRGAALVTAVLFGCSASAWCTFADSHVAGSTTNAAARSAGRQLYDAHCATCHGAALTGGPFGPSLTGPSFAAHWGKRPVAELFDFVRNNMPPSEAGTLNENEYRDIVQHVLRGSGRTVNLASTGRRTTVPRQSPEELGGALNVPSNLGPMSAPLEVFADETYRKAMAERAQTLNALSPVTDDMMRSPPPGDWIAWRRTYENISHSPLKQIDHSNVAALTVAWAWSLPVGSNEITPLVHDGVMFVTSSNQVQALDAASGTLLWRYARVTAPQYRGAALSRQRNFAIYGSNLYVATADRHLVALEAKTGHVVWDTQIVPDSLPGILLSAGPIAVHGKIIQGVGLGLTCKGGCYIVALDAETGRLTWRFNTVEQPGNQEGDTWNNAALNERTGASIWVAGSYDPDLNLIYYGTGNTYYIAPLLESHNGKSSGANDALYTDSTLALDPDSGRLVWYHQHFPRDLWDLDEAFERSLINLPIDGQNRKLVISIGKLGILDALDRTTGTYVFSKDLGLQNVVVAIDPATGARKINPALEPVDGKTVEVCPSPEGARNWFSIAYNPNTQVMFLPLEETCMDYTWHAGAGSGLNALKIDFGWVVKPVSNTDGKYARIDAVDMVTRKTLWTTRLRAPLSSSLLATDGGIVLAGNRDRVFRAIDQQTGETLWETRLDAVPNASPITFGVNGRQFIAITSGGGGPHDSESKEITPEIQDGAPATTLWVFSLPPNGR